MDALGINLSGLVTQVVSFLILFIALWAVLYRPISNAMKTRSERIREGLEAADRAREEAATARTEMEGQIATHGSRSRLSGSGPRPTSSESGTRQSRACVKSLPPWQWTPRKRSSNAPSTAPPTRI